MKRKLASLFAVVILFFLAALLGANLLVESYGRYSVSSLEQLVPEYAALLLGTTKWQKGGGENLYYKYRIEAAARLYKAGKVKKIIASGANRTIYHNEPRDITADLVKRGVPKEDIIADYAGLRTLDSVIRFKKIFGQERGIVVSQAFHNSRAIYIARQNGIELSGYNAQAVPSGYSLKTKLREIVAKFICLLDVHLLKTAPHHLGPKILIEESPAVDSSPQTRPEEPLLPSESNRPVESPAQTNQKRHNS